LVLLESKGTDMATEFNRTKPGKITAIDLDAYFGRIGYAGERTPTLETLRAIHVRHTAAIAFENLNPLLKWPVRLDRESLEQKMVRGGRGGYCYEQNLLFSHVLNALGFKVIGLVAAVLWNAPKDAIPPRTHMLLRVDLEEGRYIADVGFGALTLTGPLRLQPDIAQVTPHEPFRLTRAGEDFVLQAKLRDAWMPLYRFDLREQCLPDYEITNWYYSHHPDSRFVTGLMAARAAPDRRYALLNNELAVHRLNGGTERRVLTSAAEMRKTLEHDFHLTLPDTPQLDAALERLTAPTV
jgi:N-hydroxyarylamine O-acetyltransferase